MCESCLHRQYDGFARASEATNALRATKCRQCNVALPRIKACNLVFELT